MEKALTRLAELAKEDGATVVLAMMPDIHNLKPYPFQFIHDHMKHLSERLGWQYVDLLPALQSQKPEDLYTIPGDPHPNGLGHRLMAEALLPVVQGAVR